MKTKLAVVLTAYLKPFVEAAVRELRDECEAELYLYDDFRNIGKIFSTIPENVKGVLTSGMFPARAIALSQPTTDKIICPFNTDDAGFYNLLLRLLEQNRALDLSRVHADLIDLLDISLPEYIFGERKASFAKPLAEKVDNMGMEELFSIEEKVFQKHLKEYKEGRSDLSITRFSNLMPRLEQAGVPTRFAYPSREYLESVIRQAIRETRLIELERGLPAVVSISVKGLETHPDSFAAERRFLAIKELLLDYSALSHADCVIQRSITGYEAFTTRSALSAATRSFTASPLSAIAAERLGFNICIGYGTGLSLSQARLNASRARREAELSPMGGSFLIDFHNRLIGPLDGEQSLVLPVASAPRDFEEARRAGLSPLSVQKVRAAAAKQQDGRLTAQELAATLSITKRSASRFLKALCEAGVVVSDGENRCTTRGRPEKIFRFADRH